MLYIPILAISLSLDALAVGLSYGLRKIRIPIAAKAVICTFSILYSGSSLALGSTVSRFLPPSSAKFVGVGILTAMGLWILLQPLVKKQVHPGREKAAKNDGALLRIAIKSLGITIYVIKNPSEGDIDKSGVIDPAEALLLGLALSVDAIGVGIGSGMAGLRSAMIPLSVGLFQLLFLYAGTLAGSRFTLPEKSGRKALSALPGLLLLLVALIRIW